MPIKIAGWQKLSLIDYPGKMATVIFLAGCNMRCHYCHNRQLWDKRQNTLRFDVVLDALRERVGWLDAVVVSGGEPTMSSDLFLILRELRKLGLLIKLDTNGTRPEIVQKVVELGLVDYVALDVKAPAKKHLAITGRPIEAILETVQYLKTQKRIPYMLRTTLTPRLSADDLLEIGKEIVNGAPYWQIQQCRTENAYTSTEIKKMVTVTKQYALNVVVKGI